MTTKIVTPQEVTPEMLIAGIECNETATDAAARYQLVNGEIRYSVKWNEKWEWVDTPTIDEVKDWMAGETYDDTIWTTPIQETAQ